MPDPNPIEAENVVGTGTFDSTPHMQSSIEEILQGTAYAASSLKLLTGGNTNFIYRAQLEKPLPDGTAEVAVKHGEEYVALSPDWNIGTTRCQIEEQSLRLLAPFPQFTSPACEVRSPRLLHFIPANNTQIQEYLPDAANLKDYARKHFDKPSSLDATRTHSLLIGRSLGQWLRAFHEWSAQPAQSNVRELFATNKALQNIKKMVNYDRLLHMVSKYPSFLLECKDIFQQVADMATAELQDEAKLHTIHGDFWTGNILIPNTPIADGQQIQLRVVDWEMGQLGVRPEDFGQLVAELWELKLYKDIDAGLWMIEGFADGYGSVDSDFVFRALIHTGAHLVSMGSNTPGWGTEEQGEQVAKAGKDVLVKAWQKDRAWFDGHDLACAFAASG